MRSYINEATDFHDKEISQADSNYICLAVVLIDCIFKNDKNYYPQVSLKECKYIETNMTRYITNDLENSSDDSYDSEY